MSYKTDGIFIRHEISREEYELKKILSQKVVDNPFFSYYC